MIYLDVCCLNRPFDDQTQERIRLESEAVLTILSGCENGKWKLIGSEIIDFEVALIPDPERKRKVIALASVASEKIILNEAIKSQAKELQQIGFKPYDALHLACAENSNADIFLTTDDKLLRKAIRNTNSLKIKVENPVVWLMEVIRDEF